jgi:hypothetical protein
MYFREKEFAFREKCLQKIFESFSITFAEMFSSRKSKILVVPVISRGNKKTGTIFCFFDLKKITPGVFSQHFSIIMFPCLDNENFSQKLFDFAKSFCFCEKFLIFKKFLFLRF